MWQGFLRAGVALNRSPARTEPPTHCGVRELAIEVTSVKWLACWSAWDTHVTRSQASASPHHVNTFRGSSTSRQPLSGLLSIQLSGNHGTFSPQVDSDGRESSRMASTGAPLHREGRPQLRSGMGIPSPRRVHPGDSTCKLRRIAFDPALPLRSTTIKTESISH